MAEQPTETHRAHHNRQLFSNHFLERWLRGDVLWSEVAAEADRLRDELRAMLVDELPALVALAAEVLRDIVLSATDFGEAMNEGDHPREVRISS